MQKCNRHAIRANVYKASKQAKRGEWLPCERFVQGKRYMGKKALLPRHFIALKVNLKYFYLIEIWKFRIWWINVKGIGLFAYAWSVLEVWIDSRAVVTKTWHDLKPPKTIYNHLKPPTTTSKNSTTTYNHLQPPQKHLQPLVNNLKPSKTRYKCLK